MEDSGNESRYRVKVPVFEGPLDLLLHLIRQNRIDIYDIPISLITRQYLGYLSVMKEMNLDIASEFIVMAATLIYIKSRMLLPPDELPDEPDESDPRTELVESLIEYQTYKKAALHLREQEEIWTNAFGRPETREPSLPEEPELLLFDLSIYDLINAVRRIMSKAPPESLTISRETLTLQDRIAAILDRLETKDTSRFDDLFEGSVTRLQIIVTFLALLELLRLNLIKVYQNREFGTIWVMISGHMADEPGAGPVISAEEGRR